METIKNVLTRRELLKIGGILAATPLVACGEPGQKSPEATRLQNPYATPRTESVERPSSLERQIQGAIEKLAWSNLNREQGFSHDIAQLYLNQKSLSTLSPSFGKLSVGVETDDTKYSRIAMLHTYILSPDKKFQLETHDGKQTISYQTYEQINPQIKLSTAWLNETSENVQWLAMMKEASHLLMWPEVVKFGRQAVEQVVKIKKIDPSVDDRRVNDALWIVYSTGNLGYKVAFDFAGILAIWPYLTRVMEEPIEERHGIRRTGMDRIYLEAKKKGLNFSVPFNSDQFISLAFGTNESWFNLLKELYPEQLK